MSDVYYVSDGKLFAVRNGEGHQLRSEAVEKYIHNLKDIEQRQEWKSSGAGARFMGSGGFGFMEKGSSSENAYTKVEALTAVSPERLVYAASLDSSSGLYTKNPGKDDSAEGFIIRRANSRIFHVDYEPDEQRVVASVSDGPIQRHIALIKEEHSSFDVITEGETMEITPSFSRRTPHVIYYSSVGYYTEQRTGRTHYGAYCVNRLDLSSGDLTEVIADEKYDFIRPKESADGKLYCVRRFKEKPKGSNPFIEIALIPFRFLKAIFGWMNFFTQRYTGGSLIKGQSGGPNPARYQEKSDEDLFIEGNLINVEKTLKDNTQQGDKHPGIIPKSWELGIVQKNGEFAVAKKGVFDYAFDGEDLIYSNGKYLIRWRATGDEEVLCEARGAMSIAVI